MDTMGALAQNGIIDNIKRSRVWHSFMVLCFVIIFYILRQQRKEKK